MMDKSINKYISLKEIVILVIGIIAIFFILFALPHIIKKQPKTIDEMHAENFEKEPGENNYIYNGFSFLKLPDPQTSRLFWYTQVKINQQVFDIPMYFGPKEVQDIPILAIDPVEERNYSIMYITIDPENESVNRQYLGLTVYEFTKKLSQVKDYPIVAACTRNETLACSTRPIVDCNTTDEIVIKFNEESPEPKIIIDNNCFTIHGQNESLVKAANKLMYRFLGIIQ